MSGLSNRFSTAIESLRSAELDAARGFRLMLCLSVILCKLCVTGLALVQLLIGLVLPQLTSRIRCHP
jgi:hypothetical protein